jgi:hypothetical protein
MYLKVINQMGYKIYLKHEVLDTVAMITANSYPQSCGDENDLIKKLQQPTEAFTSVAI